MSTVATKEKPAGPEADQKPQHPVIKPFAVAVDMDGFATRNVFVRLPEGFTAQGLEDPNLWAQVQGYPGKSLKLFDRLMLVAFDESWFAEATIVRADSVSAVLSKPRITTIPPRYDRLFEDDQYRVKWYGSGYAVERKSDLHRMTGIVANAPIAERDLARLYPTRVAGR